MRCVGSASSIGNAGLVSSFEDGGNPPSLRILRHTMGQHGPNRDFPIATVRKLSRWQDTVSNEPIDVLAGDPQQLGRLGRTDLSLFADKHNRLAVAKGTRPHKVLGPERSGYYDKGDGFEMRVVEPTAQDEELVSQSQTGTSIPLTVVAVPMSDSWLERTAQRLNEDLSNPAVSVGVDLEAGKLYAAIDRQNAPDLQDDVFTEQVWELMDVYLSDGRQEGAVAEGVTADEAVDIVDGHFG